MKKDKKKIIGERISKRRNGRRSLEGYIRACGVDGNMICRGEIYKQLNLYGWNKDKEE